jgi:hypothetical protein
VSSAFFCRHCQYPLRGLTEHRCPECGQAFDPADATTMNVGRPLSKFARRCLNPTGYWFAGLSAANAAFILVATAAPGWYWGLVMLSLLIWLLIGGWWCLRVGLYILISIIYRQPLYWHKRQWLKWLVAPLVVVLTIGLVKVGAPWKTAFLLSRPAMEQLAMQARQQPNNPPQPNWVGLFPIDSVRVDAAGTLTFRIRGTGFLFEEHFFGHQPSGNWPEAGVNHRRILGSNWFTFQDDW